MPVFFNQAVVINRGQHLDISLLSNFGVWEMEVGRKTACFILTRNGYAMVSLNIGRRVRIVQFEHQNCFTQADLVRCSLTCVDFTHFTRDILIRNSRLATLQ